MNENEISHMAAQTNSPESFGDAADFVTQVASAYNDPHVTNGTLLMEALRWRHKIRSEVIRDYSDAKRRTIKDEEYMNLLVIAKDALRMFDWLERRGVYQDTELKHVHEKLKEAVQ